MSGSPGPFHGQRTALRGTKVGRNRERAAESGSLSSTQTLKHSRFSGSVYRLLFLWLSPKHLARYTHRASFAWKRPPCVCKGLSHRRHREERVRVGMQSPGSLLRPTLRTTADATAITFVPLVTRAWGSPRLLNAPQPQPHGSITIHHTPL